MPSKSNQRGVVLDELRRDLTDQQGIDREPLQEIHRWTQGIPFGGHLLLICACGCPGPFVINLSEGRDMQCGVALAWREGVSRLALCSGLEVQTLHG